MKQRVIASLVGVVLLLPGSLVAFACGLRGDAFSLRAPVEVTQVGPAVVSDGTLRVATLNVAHGRKKAVHQILLKRRRIQTHLDEISSVLRREGADVVALQEIDRPSVWSGRLDQIAYLAESMGARAFVHGSHVQGMGLSYGTGLLSYLPMQEAESATFRATPPTPPKGFVLTTITWPERNEPVDVVSVHLDFLTAKARRKQVEQMVAILKARSRPLIVMGDFNSELRPGSPLDELVQSLNLRAYQPDADAPTFVGRDARLDWILVSDELEFVDYDTVPDEVSDHRAVIADLRLR